jgi:hypothetical protein
VDPSGKEHLSGRFVIQCKFSSRAGHALRLLELADERNKAQRLVQDGLCDTYILLTNAGVSGRQAAKIDALFKGVGVKRVVTFAECPSQCCWLRPRSRRGNPLV